MPEVVLKFSLPSEQQDFDLALNAAKYNAVLWDLDQWLRSYTKYQEKKTWPKADEVRTKLYELINERGIELC
jgi:hypothetical protein